MPDSKEPALSIIITDDDVRRLLSMEECIGAMRVAFEDFSNGKAVNRPRVRYLAEHPDPERRYMANVHVGAVPSFGIACVRAGSQILRPASATNDRRLYENPRSFNWGVVILYSLETAEPVAFMHEFQLSGLRVGATTGAAVDKMARPDASRVCLFGTGKQAHTALEAIMTIRPITEVSVYSPNVEHRQAFVRDMARQGVNIVAVEDPRQGMEGADIICCATNAMRAVFDGDWLEDGQFVVSIANSDVTNKRSEVDRRTYERASAIVVNDWESVVDNGQTELLDPLNDGVFDRDQIHELGDVFTEKAIVRQPPRGSSGSGIVYFKNNSGLAIQFAAAGGLVYRKAVEEGQCRIIPTEWFGSDLSSYYEAGFRPSP
jgi:ornithine cyclodeaminase/alanine dehydrogenase-like protein (mu-crystallin family)